MRFAIYIRSVESARGAERVAVNVARGLADRGHRVDFLVEEDGAWLRDEVAAKSANITIVNLRNGGGNAVLSRLFQLRAFVASLLSVPRAVVATGDPCIGPI